MDTADLDTLFTFITPLPPGKKALQKHLKALGFVPLYDHKNSFCYTHPSVQLSQWVLKSMPNLGKRYKNAQQLKQAISRLGAQPYFFTPSTYLSPSKYPRLLIEKKVSLLPHSGWKVAPFFMLPFLRKLKQLLLATKLSDLSPMNAGFTPEGKWAILDTGNTDPRPIIDFLHQLRVHHLPAMKKNQRKTFLTCLKQSFPQAKGWDWS